VTKEERKKMMIEAAEGVLKANQNFKTSIMRFAAEEGDGANKEQLEGIMGLVSALTPIDISMYKVKSLFEEESAE